MISWSSKTGKIIHPILQRPTDFSGKAREHQTFFMPLFNASIEITRNNNEAVNETMNT